MEISDSTGSKHRKRLSPFLLLQAIDTADCMLRAVASPTGLSAFWSATTAGLKYFATTSPTSLVLQTANTVNNIRSLALQGNSLFGVLGPMISSAGGLMGLNWGLSLAANSGVSGPAFLLRGAGALGSGESEHDQHGEASVMQACSYNRCGQRVFAV